MWNNRLSFQRAGGQVADDWHEAAQGAGAAMIHVNLFLAAFANPARQIGARA
jgi:hypothetical protein